MANRLITLGSDKEGGTMPAPDGKGLDKMEAEALQEDFQTAVEYVMGPRGCKKIPDEVQGKL